MEINLHGLSHLLVFYISVESNVYSVTIIVSVHENFNGTKKRLWFYCHICYFLHFPINIFMHFPPFFALLWIGRTSSFTCQNTHNENRSPSEEKIVSPNSPATLRFFLFKFSQKMKGRRNWLQQNSERMKEKINVFLIKSVFVHAKLYHKGKRCISWCCGLSCTSCSQKFRVDVLEH